MSVPGSANPLLLASAGGYNLTRSLRFRSSASAYLNRTLTTPTSSQKFTWSGWIKRGKLDSSGLQGIFCPYSSGTVYGYLAWYQDGIRIFDRLSGGTNYLLQTTAVYRDPSAWYHIVYAVDTTQATASNRVRLYVNGVEVTAFSSSTYPTQNNSTTTNSAIPHRIGYDESNTGYLDGYQTEVNFIDGQALTPSDFGSTNASTGVWQPKKYSGSYGTNGFYLPFTDNSALTTSSNVGLGKDFSGNGNYWTTNNISITSGSTYDSMTDVPTLTSATASNFCVINPLKTYLSPTISNGNLQASSMSGGANAWGTIAVSTGKWYFEATITAAGSPAVGIIDANRAASDQTGYTATGSAAYLSDGRIRNNNANSGGGAGTYATFTTNDVIGVAFDCDAPSVSFYKNNTLQATVTPTSGIAYTIQLLDWNAGTSGIALNCGQRPFAYTPPTGFVALNTFNLPTPTIGATASTQANKYMDVTIWTGDNTTPRSISNSGSFQPDFVWLKSRSNAYQHNLYDAVRGAGAAYALSSDSTSAEGGNSSTYGYLSAFNSTGFQVTQGTAGSGSAPNGNAYTNQTSTTYVGWQWKANGTGVTNTAGSITSTVSANTSSGFSIVTYTSQSSGTGTIGHGLGVAPSMVINKTRGTAGVGWTTYHVSLGNTKYVELNSTGAATTNANIWNSTSPTSTVFSQGSEFAGLGTMVAYCFSEIAGYSKIGSYTGNGSNDGVFVHCGFLPRWIMIKRTDTTGMNWGIWDTAQNTYNVELLSLYANSNSAQINASDLSLDGVSNGFKIRGNSLGINASGGTYIFMAIAENPFKYSTAR